jgi:hypothetical protein
MTWYSRLVPRSRGRERLAANCSHTRTWHSRCRRRPLSLESLEGRALLSGDVMVSDVVNGVLTIMGDTHNNNFSIVENGGNTVTVSGIKTSINGFPSVTSSGVLDINVVLPGGTHNTDTVLLTESPGVKSGIANVSMTVTNTVTLNLTVSGVVNSGSFTLSDGTSTVVGGKLDAVVTNSRFSSLSITQSGSGSAYVELDNDTVSGAVSVYEGFANGDGIVLDAAASEVDRFGPTLLEQGFGPVGAPGDVGASDYISFSDVFAREITVIQNGEGGGGIFI